MKYDISQKEYYDALSKALLILEQPGQAGSAGHIALKELVAHTWDSTAEANIGEILSILDLPKRELALDLIIGRLRHGCPVSHDQRDRLESIYISVMKAKPIAHRIAV